MPKKNSHKEKLLRLFSILFDKTDASKGLSMPEILQELETYGIKSERKSIYKDLEKLNELGFHTEMVKKGAHTTYHYLAHPFSLSELKLLVDVINASSVLSEKTSDDLIKKLTKLTSHEQGKQLKRVVYTNQYTKSHSDHLFALLDQVYDAMDDNRAMTLRYSSWSMDKTLVDNKKVYEVSPWALIWNDENYYLLAYDHVDACYKHFRVDKIKSITKIESVRKEPLENISAYIHKHFSMFGGTEEAVTLRFPKELLGVFLDCFGTQVTLFPVQDDKVEMRVTVVLSQQFYGWLFGLGEELEILRPDSVRNTYRDMLKKALENMKE